jgi:hypothetical protein
VATTVEKLEAITDSALFETLAVRALSEIDSDCRALVHLGMNAGGKTIPGALDAFVRVPDSSPAKYVAAAFTITSSSSLRRKWLNQGTPEPKSSSTKQGKKPKQATAEKPQKAGIGDLLRAAAKAIPIRNTDPAAQFVIYLCTIKGSILI